MIKPLLSFFIAIAFFGNAYAGITGSADDRVVIGWDGEQPDYSRSLSSTQNIWNTSPYNSIVHILPIGCTGEFISPKHILTNAHCARDCEEGQANCEIHTSDNQVLHAGTVFYGMKKMSSDSNWLNNQEKDWAIFEIVDDYCRAEYRQFGDYPPSSTMSGLWRAGFGSLRVLSREDIAAMRTAYVSYLRAGGKYDSYTGGMDIHDKDPNFRMEYKVFFDEFTRITGKDFLREYAWDINTLKLVRNCQFTGPDNKKEIVRHNCDSWGGDSGSSVKSNINYIVSLNYGGWSEVTTTDEMEGMSLAILPYFSRDPNIQSAIKRAEQECKNWNPEPIKPEPDKKNCDLTCENTTIYVGGQSGCYHFVENENKCSAATGKHLRSDGQTTDGAYKYTCVDYNKSPVCRGQTVIPITPQPSDDCDLRCDNITVTCRGDYESRWSEKKCKEATGNVMRREADSPDGHFIWTCVDYDKSPVCTGRIISPVNPPITPIPREGECTQSDLPAHATSGRYAICDEFSLGCEEWQRGQQYCEATACENGYGVAGGICVKEFQYKVIND